MKAAYYTSPFSHLPFYILSFSGSLILTQGALDCLRLSVCSSGLPGCQCHSRDRITAATPLVPVHFSQVLKGDRLTSENIWPGLKGLLQPSLASTTIRDKMITAGSFGCKIITPCPAVMPRSSALGDYICTLWWNLNPIPQLH